MASRSRRTKRLHSSDAPSLRIVVRSRPTFEPARPAVAAFTRLAAAIGSDRANNHERARVLIVFSPLHAAVQLGAFDRGGCHLRELHEYRFVELGELAAVFVEGLDESDVAAVKSAQGGG